jgi:vacuolar-type H+-ATPase subunit I/STV1
MPDDQNSNIAERLTGIETDLKWMTRIGGGVGGGVLAIIIAMNFFIVPRAIDSEIKNSFNPEIVKQIDEHLKSIAVSEKKAKETVAALEDKRQELVAWQDETDRKLNKLAGEVETFKSSHRTDHSSLDSKIAELQDQQKTLADKLNKLEYLKGGRKLNPLYTYKIQGDKFAYMSAHDEATTKSLLEGGLIIHSFKQVGFYIEQ